MNSVPMTALGLVAWLSLALGHTPPAPGYGELGYEPPAPGSYDLPPLGDAADGDVLDTQGNQRALHGLFGGHLVILSFIYRSCEDANGCPLAATVLHRVRQETAKDPELARNLRLISLSFDPERDTSERMGHYAKNFRFTPGGAEWHFLTTASRAKLQPILDAYGQSVVRGRGPNGEETGAFAHVLRVFLIDRDARIRNVYSPSFLHPGLLINDARTLLMEEVPVPAVLPAAAETLGPADNRTGYERDDSVTRFQSLAAHRGQPMDLLATLREPPLGLPPIPISDEDPVTPTKLVLGRKLFFDRRLSFNETFSCAMCHIPEQGFTSNALKTAAGIEGRSVRRNAPSLFNAGYAQLLFHDGREIRLKHQAWAPLLASNEMGNPSIASVIEKIRRLPDYRGLFETAFGRAPDMETVGDALAGYQRTLNSADSPFDRWYYGGDPEAVSVPVKRGFAVFMGKGGCSGCHSVGPVDALFTDQGLHNTGIGYRASMGPDPHERHIRVAPGIRLRVASGIIQGVSGPAPSDLGRYEITQDPDDLWKYKTPSLRNVALSAPYMHDGSLATLVEVVEFYDQGGAPNPLIDPRIRPLGLSEREKVDLVTLLNALTGSNADALVADAKYAPVGDADGDDPSWWEQDGGASR